MNRPLDKILKKGEKYKDQIARMMQEDHDLIECKFKVDNARGNDDLKEEDSYYSDYDDDQEG